LYHLKLHQLHSQYGPIVRVAPDELSYISAEAWRDIYSNRNIPKNRVWAGQQEETHPISIVSTDEATHFRNRRALAGAFTEHAINEHASLIEGLVETLLQKLGEQVVQGEGCAVVNFTDWFNWLTFDISGALSFGESFGSVADGRAHPWVEISCGFGKGIALVASINFYRPLNKLLKLSMPRSIMEKMKYHQELAHEKLMQRLGMEDKAKAQDYVGSILAYNQGKGEAKISDEEIEANMTVLIFAGSETTSTAMTAILTQLLQNQEALTKLVTEVRANYESEKDINITSVAKLEYLTAVIQEGIRMGPPVAVALPRITPGEGAHICGQHVPGNTFVSVNQYPTFRSAMNFTDPDLFVPERFLPHSPYPSDRIDAFEPFLLGRHKCMGQKLAWTIMRLTLARLFFAFDMEAVDYVDDFGLQKTFIFWEKKTLKVQLRKRYHC
jgi:cytochrome P450